ncbi:MAG: D-lactate dehydrogenase [Gammaproteobacteria bacterium]|jgi:D-lactate dehydrogenase
MNSLVSDALIPALVDVVGKSNVLTSDSRTSFYRTGIRIGRGSCRAVVLPESLLEIWRVLKICVANDLIIILQAANTGLNGGSTPNGEDYDRGIVIINTLKIDDLVLLNGGEQVVAFAGATLYQLEDKLKPLNRGPHSVIGSSCIGASVVGGVCNNSGGNLVNRGPAYTELSVYAQLGEDGELRLVNQLGIELGDGPEEILTNLQAAKFDPNPSMSIDQMASDREYQQRVRDIEADTPARFNADKRRLHESSGCAGKLAVFAVRLDTFADPERDKVFYIGTNDPTVFTALRKHILSEFKVLPEMGEYMHNSYFDGADKYCKDNYLAIKYFGTAFLPKLFAFKGRVDGYLAKLSFLPDKLVDRSLQFFASLMPDHLPKRIRDYRTRFEHHLIIKANDDVIEVTHELLNSYFNGAYPGEFFVCDDKEADAALLHRFVAGSASGRYALIHSKEIGGIMPLDIALRRNDDDWHCLYSPEILDQLAAPFRLAHFFCMVFHHDFVVKKGVDPEALKAELFALLDARGAKYPAEHNVGHLYPAEADLRDFYQQCDPLNAFNPGIGKTSKLKHYA